ncbi:MAG: hypothetical protein QOD06_2321 [Candidatus Binatota bacterium]|nr:hypothetical protein [Candidatus Binatota bacterium]
MSRFPRARRATLLLLAALVFSGVEGAGARSLEIQRFDADLTVPPDGVLVVRETIRAHFTGEWNGLYRTIPIEYRTPQGFNYRLLLDGIGATDEEGRALKIESSRERHYRKLKVWVPGATDATRTIVLRYRVENALRFFDDHDELYWNVTGDEWDVALGLVAARVSLPERTTGLRATAFTGAYGSTASDAELAVDRSRVEVRMRRPLGFREGLTIAVGWDKGVVAEPSAWRRAAFFLRSNWPFAIPLVVFAAMLVLWRRYGRDPRLRPISPAYEPPDRLTPAEAGTLTDDRADLRDVTATIVDLAVRGFLDIEEREEPRFLGLWSGKEYVFHRQKDPTEWQALATHERQLLSALFEGKTSVELSDLENRFYRDLPKIQDAIVRSLVSRGYYVHRPDTVRQIFVVIAVVVGVGGAAAGLGGADAFGIAPLTAIISAAASALVILGFARIMPARTPSGARTLEGVLGFEEFLSRVESDRIERTMHTPETFEKYLPYAMALGVEHKWVRAFDDVYREPPRWYRGGSPGSFRPTVLVGDLGRMSARTAAMMTSRPRSSGGSGLGGGGSSGGGFGGGGGGGF